MLFWFIISIIVINIHTSLARTVRGVSVISARYNNDIRLQTLFQDSITLSIDISLENCQEQFKWDPWNCPSTDFFSKRSATLLDRESAFVQSITIAALIYTVTKNCSRGDIEGCGCGNYRKIYENAEVLSSLAHCSDQVDVSEQITSILFKQSGSSRMDAQAYAVVHNNRAARLAVRNSLRKHCKCHGLSGSCTMQNCWMALDTFPEIASELRRMYDRSIHLTYNNNGSINTNIREDVLVYVLDSPNYCKPNAIPGWTGTVGRQCSRNKDKTVGNHERKSCKKLCRSCGHRVRKQTVARQNQCNCKFNWCCDVTCDTCTEYVNEYYCA